MQLILRLKIKDGLDQNFHSFFNFSNHLELKKSMTPKLDLKIRTSVMIDSDSNFKTGLRFENLKSRSHAKSLTL